MVNVGIYSFGKCHTIDKYFQIMTVLDRIEKDEERFRLSIVVDGTGLADEDLFNYYPRSNVIDLRNIDINDCGLDCVVVIDPYSRPYIPYSRWKVPIVYKEYGVAGAEAGAGYLIKKSAYRYADLIITDNDFMRYRIKEVYPNKKVIVGSPAFDFAVNSLNFSSPIVLRDSQSRNFNVLWTPHHSIESKESFDKIEGGTYSTFVEYRDYLVGDFLRENPDVNLLVKYHPILPRRYNAYCKSRGISHTFSQWVKKVKTSEFKDRVAFYDKTDYHELFAESDLILNDSISFLQEWLPTKKPMIVLRSLNSSKFSPYGEHLIRECYESVYSVNDLAEIFRSRVDFTQMSQNKMSEIRNLYITSEEPNSNKLVDIIYERYNQV